MPFSLIKIFNYNLCLIITLTITKCLNDSYNSKFIRMNKKISIRNNKKYDIVQIYSVLIKNH